MFSNIFHIFFFNVIISIASVCLSLQFLPAVDNVHMEGAVSQIFDIGPTFYFMLKNKKLFVTIFLSVVFHVIK